MNPLRIACDMTFPNRNGAGTGEYARELLRAIRRCDGVAVLPIAGPPRSGLVRTLGWLLRGATEEVRRSRADVLHCPALVTPLRSAVPLVVTVHDDAVSRFPGGHPLEWRLFTRHALPKLARRADMIITPTEFIRGELLADWHLDPERVVAIPHGIAHDYAAAAHAAVPSRSGRPLILFAGAPIERKNLGLVLRAMVWAPASSALAEADLLISGATAESFPHHATDIADLGLGSRVRWLGMVARDAMPALYRQVDLLVYPSLYEGFGLPPLEAMAAATPVVAARAASLPETLGDAAVLVDPHDAEGLAAAIQSLLSDSELRTRMIATGCARATTFTWDRCAAATVAVYRRAVGEQFGAPSVWP